MNILYASTRNYYPYLEVTIRSLLEHNKDVKIFVFAEDDSLPFEIPVKHEIINISNQKYFLQTSPNYKTYFTFMSFMRVCAPDLLKVNKVIYLDVDTIICDNLEPLWATDIKGKLLGWVEERRGSWRPYGPKYYNAGVLLMNLVQMRKEGFTNLIVDALNNEYYRFNEQDAMNRLLPKEKTVELDTRWNESFCCGHTDKPAIVHFAGRRFWYEDKKGFRWEYFAKYNNG